MAVSKRRQGSRKRQEEPADHIRGPILSGGDSEGRQEESLVQASQMPLRPRGSLATPQGALLG